MKSIVAGILIMAAVITSCNSYSEKKETVSRRSRDEMADINRYLIAKDRERILNYIERHNLLMKESPTGLWYSIKTEGEGSSYKDGDKVRFNYKCTLLDGSECYSSDETGPREIIIGRSQAEQGLVEGLKLLRPGAEATFIIPPYLAFGLIGDGKKIPSRAIVVYNVIILRPDFLE
jgi:FKBP-type peptidyl-prolyl cis-trans isomerase